MRISDWSSDVCSSDLCRQSSIVGFAQIMAVQIFQLLDVEARGRTADACNVEQFHGPFAGDDLLIAMAPAQAQQIVEHRRSEEHTSELQSLMRTSYAVFCLKKKKPHTNSI